MGLEGQRREPGHGGQSRPEWRNQLSGHRSAVVLEPQLPFAVCAAVVTSVEGL